MYITVTDIYACGHTLTSVSYQFKRLTVNTVSVQIWVVLPPWKFLYKF